MKRLIVFSLLFLCAASGYAQQLITYGPYRTAEGAGVSTCTLQQHQSSTFQRTGRGQVEWIWTWTASSGGTVTLTMPTSVLADGTIMELETDPGSPAPTDNYDITIKDSHGFDLLQGNGADRDTANTEVIVGFVTDASTHAYSLIPADDSLVFQVTNAGSGKKGVAILRMLK